MRAIVLLGAFFFITIIVAFCIMNYKSTFVNNAMHNALVGNGTSSASVNLGSNIELEELDSGYESDEVYDPNALD